MCEEEMQGMTKNKEKCEDGFVSFEEDSATSSSCPGCIERLSK